MLIITPRFLRYNQVQQIYWLVLLELMRLWKLTAYEIKNQQLELQCSER